MAKEAMRSSKGWTCMYCGQEKCSCGNVFIVAGLILLILGIWLWVSPEALPMVVAVVLLLGGIKKIMLGIKWPGR